MVTISDTAIEAAAIMLCAASGHRWDRLDLEMGDPGARLYRQAMLRVARNALSAAEEHRTADVAQAVAAERERCVGIILGELGRFAGDDDMLRYARLVLRSVARKLDPVAPEQAARALEAHHAATIARTPPEPGGTP